MPPLPTPPRADEEVRIALVMNGGVSLAIWMGGVTQELDRLRRAGYDDLAALAPDPGPWRQLVAALGLRVKVDVVAGASAGGLNGTVLAASIARRRAMPELREVWLRLGDLRARLLIHDDDTEPREVRDTPAVLNGTFFHDEIQKVFEGIAPDPTPPAASDAERTAAEDRAPAGVTAFMTATALNGTSGTWRDEAGSTFQQREHRVRFRFARAADPAYAPDGSTVEPEDSFAQPEANRQLARAARSTASFPGAFEPVFCAIGPAAPGPDMGPVSNLHESRWVIDGGVLDNEPFGPVFDEIRARTVERTITRLIAYVVPSAGIESDGGPDAPTPRRGLSVSVPASFNLPRETGIVDDLARLRDLLNGVQVERGMVRSLLRSATDGTGGVGTLAPTAAALYPFYRRRRVLGGLWEIRQVLAGRADVAVVELRPPPEWAYADALPDVPWAPRGAAPALDPAGTWSWGFDAAFTMLRAWLSVIRDGLERDGSAATLATGAQTISRGLLQLAAVRDAFVAGVAAGAGEDAATAPDAQILSRGQAAFAPVAGADGARVRAIVDESARAYVTAAAELPADVQADVGGIPDDPDAVVERHLRVEVVHRTFQPPTRVTPAPRFRFLRVSTNATSPLDGADVRKSKLTGTQLHHFGAFLKRSWRANDWMWGRLDGVHHVVTMLVTTDRLRALSGRGAPTLDAVTAGIEALVGGTSAARAGELVRAVAASTDDAAIAEELAELRRLVVARIQLDVLRDELPRLVADVRGEAKGGTVVSADEEEWIRCLYAAGSKAGGPLTDDEAIARGFRACRIGDQQVADVLASDAGQEGRRETILSALRAFEKDQQAPGQLKPVVGAIRIAVRGRGFADDARDAVTSGARGAGRAVAGRAREAGRAVVKLVRRPFR